MKKRLVEWIAAAAAAAAAAAGLRLSALEQPVPDPAPGLARATFAGGCFWSMEHVFDELAGVVSVMVGYTGGAAKNPSYEQVELGVTGHAESVQVVYDPKKIDYEKLLDAYWHNTDPTDGGGQFCDHGTQYRPVIFYNDDVQKQIADASKKALEDSHRFKRILTQIVPRVDLLAGRGVPPALLQDECVPIQNVSRRVRPRPAAGGPLGQGPLVISNWPLASSHPAAGPWFFNSLTDRLRFSIRAQW